MLQEKAIDDVFNFTQLQRFRQNRDLLAFDKSKPAVANAAIDSDSSDLDSSDDEDGFGAATENRNSQN